MKTAEARPFIAARLAACAALTGIPVMMELPPAATPDEIAAEEKTFEGHLAAKGIVLVLLRPIRAGVGGIAAGAIVGALVPIAICENPEVNRSATGLKRDVDEITDEVIAACLCDLVAYPASPDTPPARTEGLVVSYVNPVVRCKIRASGNTAPEFRPPV